MVLYFLDDFTKLKGLQDTDTWIPDKTQSQVVVAENDGEIVAFWVAQTVLHLEPVWIRPDHRSGWLFIKMWRMLLQWLTAQGMRDFYCFAPTQTIKDYLTRLGMKPFAQGFRYHIKD